MRAITQVRLMKVKLSSVKPVSLLRVNVRQTCCCWSSVFCRSTQVRQVSPPPHTHTAGLCLCSLISHLLVGLFLDSEFTTITPEGVLKTQRLQNRFKWFLCLLCVTSVNILFAAGGSTQIQNQRNPTVNGTAQESSLFSARFGFTGDPRVNESEVFTLHVGTR